MTTCTPIPSRPHFEVLNGLLLLRICYSPYQPGGWQYYATYLIAGSIFAGCVAFAWLILRLYDKPVREWLSRQSDKHYTGK
ncbi:hypothetical protein ECE50_010395 [Chitinophaga sp. Mgbs1]|uniref:Uncharacterized protein n=1 Tax=Chitinophaga solisilvae TaxID=1233460 RepID=A0A3S1DSB5_9BACT|nr:hypothetical protein [Chitinophaga solisilvae]